MSLTIAGHIPHGPLTLEHIFPTEGISALIGPSGSGKTSLLRTIAGLERYSDMQVKFDTIDWQSPKHFLHTHQRHVGYVFQEANLFPHMTTRQNLAYAEKRKAHRTAHLAIDEAIALFNLGDLLEKPSTVLSGGERQRVAIARALLAAPQLLLMDEPLAALDEPRKAELIPYLAKLRSDLSLPIIYVSHAIAEIAQLADHLSIIDDGQIVAHGPLQSVLSEASSNRYLHDETGVVLTATVDAFDAEWQIWSATLNGHGTISWTGAASHHRIGEQVRLRILARDVSVVLNTDTQSSILNRLPVEIESIEGSASGSTFIRMRCGEDLLLAKLTKKSIHDLALTSGTRAFAQVKSVAVVA